MTSKRQMHFNLGWKLKPGTIEKNSPSTTGRPGKIKSMAVRHHWATKQACITAINTHNIRLRLSKDPIPSKDPILSKDAIPSKDPNPSKDPIPSKDSIPAKDPIPSKDSIPAKDLPVDPFFSTVPNLNCNTCMI